MTVLRECDSDLTNFGTWVHDFGDRVYRYWVYKKVYTPYEQSEKFTDESMFEDDYANYGCIEEAIELPDGDILIGFVEPNQETKYIQYYKLSDICLAYSEDDKYEYEEDDSDNEYNNITVEELYGTKEAYNKLMGVDVEFESEDCE